MKKDFSEMDSLEVYLRQLSSYKPLSTEEECSLAKKIQKGDRRAKKKLVLANLRFVVSVARNYTNQGMALPDLINEGNLGLIRAASKFDGEKNFKFISYAVWWIRQSILKALAEQSRITHIPLHAITVLSHVAKAQLKLEQKYGRIANAQEIAIELEHSYKKTNIEEIENALRIGSRYVSLDQPVGVDKDIRMLDIITDDNQESAESEMSRTNVADKIKGILKQLKGNEEYVLRLYFGIGEESTFTLEEIGQKLNLTRERVRQIKERGLQRLKHLSKSRNFKELTYS
jgi:RNA polymerase primary sigma factor